MKKKIIISLVMICLSSILLIGCSGGGTYSTTVSTDSSGKNKLEMYYKNFKGNRYKMVDLKEGEGLLLTSDVETKGGSLAVKVYDEDENVIYEIKDPTSEITDKIDINKSGKYKIEVSGDHSGSFKVSWEEK